MLVDREWQDNSSCGGKIVRFEYAAKRLKSEDKSDRSMESGLQV